MRTEKRRWPLAVAEGVAAELVAALAPHCERLVVAGSVRRRKPTVGDIELVFIPKFGPRRVGLGLFPEFGPETDAVLERWLHTGVLVKRPGKTGATAWGGKIKLGVHRASGVPVDLFSATEENWFNYLVCRTGPAESNRAICVAAQALGWKWEPYSSGFVKQGGWERQAVTSERDVFDFVGLAYRPPEDRR